MKAFLEEYGLALFVMIVVIVLILLASPIGKVIGDSLKSVIETFAAQTSSQIKNAVGDISITLD